VPIGDPTSVTVDVHADWEGIGALIFGILLVLLFGFGIVRNIVRRRSRRAEDDGDAGDAVDGGDAVTASSGSAPADAEPRPEPDAPEERPGG
jgi:hypothetical protein